MVRGKFRQIAEAIGVLGVIGSLVFVGFEVRQSALATKAETDALLAGAFLELNLTLASNPELASALANGETIRTPHLPKRKPRYERSGERFFMSGPTRIGST